MKVLYELYNCNPTASVSRGSEGRLRNGKGQYGEVAGAKADEDVDGSLLSPSGSSGSVSAFDGVSLSLARSLSRARAFSLS